ncbi:hypothetical protein OsJ_27129 [Oryza sativa Japonica Group]|uniref:Uncharacterized protein n=1 Tax=Oryza sativa subsp. japonica TaxID=39947 RepID=A3BSM5_ORYSJ|nr:hypothetical protein OsJ_27129 [Oryza sativa Japonica Group]
MSGIDGNKPPSEVLIDENDDWVIVKKQRITILIPPPSPAAASLQDDMQKISSEQACIAKKSMENCDAARKKHPKQMTTNKAQEPLLEGIKVSANIKKAQEIATSSHHPVAPVVKANHASIQGLFHENIEKAGNSFGNIYKEELPVISSQVTNRIMRARLLERRVAGFGGLKNWLFTCGFGWFVDILDSEKLGMYQIVSLTMNQLKDMGLDAVGESRQLWGGGSGPEQLGFWAAVKVGGGWGRGKRDVFSWFRGMAVGGEGLVVCGGLVGRWRVDLQQGAMDLGGWRRNAVRANWLAGWTSSKGAVDLGGWRRNVVRAIWPAGEAPRPGGGVLEEASVALVRACGEKKDMITVVHGF